MRSRDGFIGSRPATPRHFGWLWNVFLLSGATLLPACSTPTSPFSDALPVSSYELVAEREALSGELTSVSGHLISAQTIGKNICLKVLVDETFRFAPTLVIENRGWATEPPLDLKQVYERSHQRRLAPNRPKEAVRPEVAAEPDEEPPARNQASALGWMGRLLPHAWSAGLPSSQRLEARVDESRAAAPAPLRTPARPVPAPLETRSPGDKLGEPDLRVELARAEAFLRGHAPAVVRRQAVVIQACRRPPTRANRKALEHALQWLKPLKKPERIESAPSLSTVRQELQLFYLERSREYDWAPLTWEEIALTGVLLGPEEVFEEEVIGGVDMVPYALGVHDPQRGRWMFLDLSSGDSYSKELVIDLLRDVPTRVLRKAGNAAVRGGLP